MEPRFASMSEIAPEQVVDFLLSVGLPRAIIEWKYFDARCNSTQGERGVVLVRGDRVVGFTGYSRFACGSGAARRHAYWLYDWIKSEAAGKGTGRRLFQECVDRCGLALAPGGSAIARHLFTALCTRVVPGAYVSLSRPLRLGLALDRIPVRRLPAPLRSRLSVRPGGPAGRIARTLERVPLAPGLTLGLALGRGSRAVTAALRTEPGVSRAIESLVESVPVPVPEPGQVLPAIVRPHYDFEYIDWQLGRCPSIETATTYISDAGGTGARAAVLHWRSTTGAGAGRYWRMALFGRPGAELDAVVDHVLDLAYRRGAMAVRALASYHDRDVLALLRARRFLPGRSRMPLWYFRGAGETAPVPELEGTSFLDTDLAYRF